MFRSLLVLGSLLSGLLLTPPLSAQNHPFDAGLDRRLIQPHIEFLASPELRGRSGPDARRAAEYIRSEFRALDLEPLFEDDYFQNIPMPEGHESGLKIAGQNVGAVLRGRDPAVADEFVIVSAHYDHLGIRNGRLHPGADDNASGVSMMLAVARRLAEASERPRRSIVFVGFDLEERMLWGSRWFAAHSPVPLDKVSLFITADMIGRSLGNLDLPTVFVLGSEHAPAVRHLLDEIGTPDGLEAARLGIDLIGTRSDYGPFRDRKIPFLFFSTGEHPDYHTPDDVPERIDVEKVVRVSQLIQAVTVATANHETRPEWTDHVVPAVDEAKAVFLITRSLLDRNDEQLSSAQRFLISFINVRTKQIVERGSMTPDERGWLTRMSQVLLLSVF